MLFLWFICKSLEWFRGGCCGQGPACLQSPASCWTVVDLKPAVDMTSSWVLLAPSPLLSGSELNYFSFSKHKTKETLTCFAHAIGTPGCVWAVRSYPPTCLLPGKCLLTRTGNLFLFVPEQANKPLGRVGRALIQSTFPASLSRPQQTPAVPSSVFLDISPAIMRDLTVE